MSKATADKVREEFGELEDLEIAQIMDLEPSEEELVAASAWFDIEDDAARDLDDLAPGAARIVDIVESAYADEEEAYR